MDTMEAEEGTYMEVEDNEDEGVEMEDEGDSRLAYWAWLGEEEDTMWEVEDDTDSIVLNLNLTEDEEEEELWE
jgi:hypothetical protein